MRHVLLLVALAVPAAASAQVVVSVSTDRAVYTTTDTVRVAITATNPTAGSVTLQFGSGHQGDFELNGVSSSCGWITMSTELTVAAGESYTWGGPDDARPGNGVGCWDYAPGYVFYSALTPGMYTVRGFVGGLGDPVYGEATTTITVLAPPLAPEDGASAAGGALRVVGPNPARGSVAVALQSRAAETVTLAVVDALGRVVRTVGVGASAGETRVVLDVRGLPAGTYVLRVAGRPDTAPRFVVAR